MANTRHGPTLRHVGALFTSGTVADLSDGQLLERYAAGGGEASELAFAALFERYGAMVLRVCRDVLGDEHAAQDAFQATFVVLVRRSAALRPRTTLGPWLHEAASRVALAARSAAYRRQRHERRAAELHAPTVAVDAEQKGDDLSRAVHEEVDRLPDRYRAAVVLCCLQGLTHEQAAGRLGCPLGTVQSRVARGRERLRGRLVRRGLAPGAIAVALATPAQTARAVPFALAEATLRGLTPITAAGSSAMTSGAFPASAAALADGVLRTMMLSKLKLAAAALLSAVILAAGTGILAGQTGGRQQEPGAAAAGPVARQGARAGVADVSEDEWGAMNKRRLASALQARRHRLVQAARERLEKQHDYYKEGRITIDRYLDASNQLQRAEVQANPSRDGRITAARAHLDRVKDIEAHERAELETGRGTTAEVAEATLSRVQAELDIIEALKPEERPEIADLYDRVTALETKLDRALKALEELKRPRD